MINAIEYKIGYLAAFIILKSMPDYDSYLTKILNSEVLALLPKKYARKEFKIGETGMASIYGINGSRVTLTQRSPQYVRRILEYLLSDICINQGILIKRSSIIIGRYIKVAIDTPDNHIGTSYELYDMLKQYTEDIRFENYFGEKLSFVKYSNDIKEFVVNALCPPGHLESIEVVTSFDDGKEVHVIVDNRCLGLFIGKRGLNITLASKLCYNVKIEIKGIGQEVIEQYRSRNQSGSN